MNMSISVIALLLILIRVCSNARAADEAGEGKATLKNQCAFHTNVVGKNGFGPSLAQVIGRRSGGLPGFKCSLAMNQAGLVWDPSTPDSFLILSTAKVPGTQMQVGIAGKLARGNIIASLQTPGSVPSAPSASSQKSAATSPPSGCMISRNGPARFRVNGPTLHGLPAEPRFESFTRPFSSRQVF